MGFSFDVFGDLPIIGEIMGGGAEEAAEAQQKAAAEQLATQERLSKWGYGYPDWLTGYMQTIAQKGAAYEGADVDPYISALRGEVPQMQDILQERAGALRDVATPESRVDIDFARYLRGSEESLGGVGREGFRERAFSEASLNAAALRNQEARAEQEQQVRFGGQAMDLDIRALGMGSSMEQAIANANALRFTSSQEAAAGGLNPALGLGSRSFSAPWPGIDPKLAAEAAFSASMQSQANSVAGMWGMNNAMTGGPGTAGVTQGQSVQNPGGYPSSYQQPTYNWFDQQSGGTGGGNYASNPSTYYA